MLCISLRWQNHHPHLSYSYLQYPADGETLPCRLHDCGWIWISHSWRTICMFYIFTDLRCVCLISCWSTETQDGRLISVGTLILASYLELLIPHVVRWRNSHRIQFRSESESATGHRSIFSRSSSFTFRGIRSILPPASGSPSQTSMAKPPTPSQLRTTQPAHSAYVLLSMKHRYTHRYEPFLHRIAICHFIAHWPQQPQWLVRKWGWQFILSWLSCSRNVYHSRPLPRSDYSTYPTLSSLRLLVCIPLFHYCKGRDMHPQWYWC